MLLQDRMYTTILFTYIVYATWVERRNHWSLHTSYSLHIRVWWTSPFSPCFLFYFVTTYGLDKISITLNLTLEIGAPQQQSQTLWSLRSVSESFQQRTQISAIDSTFHKAKLDILKDRNHHTIRRQTV